MYAPFAGTYILGSRLAPLTKNRGLPSLTDTVKFLKENVSENYKAVLLEQFDILNLDTCETIKADKTFDKSYDEYVDEISTHKLAFDDDEWDDSEIPDLIDKAHVRFKAKATEINFNSDTMIIVQSDRISYKFNPENYPVKINADEIIAEPFIKFTLDHNLLHRLPRGPRYAHWNNAEIGNHIRYLRKPDIFERGLHHCLCYFHS